MGQQTRGLRGIVDSVTVEEVFCKSDYDQLLALRHRAYLHVGLITESIDAEKMRDEYDDRSFIFVAKMNGMVVGTGRLTRCLFPEQTFLFEKNIPFPFHLGRQRDSFLECSRVAVEPTLHGAGIFLALSRELAMRSIAEGKEVIAIARTAQRLVFAKIGWRTFSDPIPHPLLKDQTLALMHWDPEKFLAGESLSPVVRRLVLDEVRGRLKSMNSLSSEPQALQESIGCRTSFRANFVGPNTCTSLATASPSGF